MLIYRLRPLVCDKSHEHGVVAGSETKASQIWTWKSLVADSIAELVWLVELDLRRMTSRSTDLLGALVDQDLADRRSVADFPAVEKSSSSKETRKEKGEKFTSCPGCRGHKVRTHPSHTRRPGQCRFPFDVNHEYSCPACRSGAGRLDPRHTFDVDCRLFMEDIEQKGAPSMGPRHARDPRRPASRVAGSKARATPRPEDDDDDELVPPGQGQGESDPLDDLFSPPSVAN